MEERMRPNIFPVLRYQDGHAAVDWLVRAFGFEKRGAHEAPDGSVAHAELCFGSGVVGLSSVRATPGDSAWSRVRQGIYITVKEVDDRAKAAGADIAMPLTDQAYGSRDFGARDPEGHLWGFGTYDMAAGEGEPNIFVGLHYADGRAALGWLERAFGVRTAFEVPGRGGAVEHVEMRLGDGAVMLDSGPKDENAWGDNAQVVHVYLPDPDEHHARAKAAGAYILEAPKDTAWGSRGYYARDLDGFLWGFSTYKPH
jgi:uncharacterized glyoxalase superfamily protein PhnB